MLDTLISLADVTLSWPIADWDPTGTKNYETGEDDNWVNSSFDLNFGSRTQWTLVGRETAVNYGRKLEYKIDVDQFVLQKLPSITNFIGGGFTSFTYGSENNLSYGSSNWTFQRKVAADQEFEMIGEINRKTKYVHAFFIMFGLAIVVIYRVNALTGFWGAQNKESVEKNNSLLTNGSNKIQYLHISLITKWEKASYAKNAVERAVAKLKDIAESITDQGIASAIEVQNRVSAILNSLDAKQRTDQIIINAKNDINNKFKDGVETLTDVITHVGAVIDVFQSNRKNWYETNKKLELYCDSFKVDAVGNKDTNNTINPVTAGTLTLEAYEYDNATDQIDKKSTFSMTPTSISINTNNKDSYSIIANEKDLNVKSNSIELQTNEEISKLCKISLNKETQSINILTGPATTCPSIQMDGNNKELLVAVGTVTLGSSIKINNDGIKIGHTSEIQQATKRSLISIDGGEISLSSGVSQIKIDETKITLKAGPNEIKLDLTELKESVVTNKSNAELLQKLEKIIEDQKVEILKHDATISRLKHILTTIMNK